MSDTLKITDLNAVWEGNLEAISHFFCGSGHVIAKHGESSILIQGFIMFLIHWQYSTYNVSV